MEQKVNIINLSVEFYKDNAQIKEAIKKATDKNILVVASAGNPLPNNEVKTVYPASYKNVVSVGMLDTNGDIYSKIFEKKKTDVYAMGEDVTGLYLNNKMTYDTAASFATANATGTFALLMNKNSQAGEKTNQKKLVQQYERLIKGHSSNFSALILSAWGFLIIGIPLLMVGGIVFWLVKKKQKKTGL